MDSEKMEAVFSELLENQKELARSQGETMAAFQEMKAQMETLQSGINKNKCNAAPVDKSFQQVVERGITEIKFLMHTQISNPAPNNWRVFLESEAKKWAVYLVVALTFLTYLYRFFMR